MAIRGPREILTYRGEGVPIINLINAIQECVCESARHTGLVVSNFQHNRTVHFITDSPPQPLHAPWLQFTRTCALQLGCPGRLKLVEEREGAWHT